MDDHGTEDGCRRNSKEPVRCSRRRRRRCRCGSRRTKPRPPSVAGPADAASFFAHCFRLPYSGYGEKIPYVSRKDGTLVSRPGLTAFARAVMASHTAAEDRGRARPLDEFARQSADNLCGTTEDNPGCAPCEAAPSGDARAMAMAPPEFATYQVVFLNQ
jgi:hypothetical protein